MPPRPKGPRLYLRKYKDRASTWIIIDGRKHRYLGFSESDRTQAEEAMRAYINFQHGGRPEHLCAETAAILPRTRVGTIYFLSCDQPTFPIKIGFADDTKERLATLQCALPWPVALLATMPGNRELERELHARFSRLRMSGEWFARCDELIEFIRALQAPAVVNIPIRKRAQRRTQHVVLANTLAEENQKSGKAGRSGRI